MHIKKIDNNKVKTYLQGLRPFKNSIPKNLKKILSKRGYVYAEILGKWSFLIGDKISKYCYPKSLKLIKNQNSNALIVHVKRGNELEVEYSKAQIIKKINSYFGYQLVCEVRLETFSEKKDEKSTKKEFLIKKNLTKFNQQINEINNKSSA